MSSGTILHYWEEPIPAVDPEKSSVEVSPSSVPADGASLSTITVTLRDSAASLITGGRPVAIGSSRGEDVVAPASGYGFGESDENGLFKAFVSAANSCPSFRSGYPLTPGDSYDIGGRALLRAGKP